jgi:magnesium-transporting ATPase (P-type)
LIFDWDFTDDFLKPLAEYGGLMMLILGIIWIIFVAYETKRRGSFKKRKSEDWDFNNTKFLKSLTYFGFLVGLFAILTGVSELMFDRPPTNKYEDVTQNAVNIFTAASLIIVGILTFVKPGNDLPLASLFGLFAASAIIVIITLVLPPEVEQVIGAFVNFRLFLFIVFIIIFAIIALIVKFYTAGFMTVSKVLSWPPLGIIVSAFCFLQGFLLLVFGVSISGIF